MRSRVGSAFAERLGIGMVLCVLWGCSDAPTGVGDVDRADTRVEPSDVVEVTRAPAFTLDLSVTGDLVPGGEIAVDALVSSAAAGTAVLELAAPEIRLAGDRGWQALENVPVGDAIEPLLQTQVLLGDGSSSARTVRFRVGAPGYYRVSGSVEAAEFSPGARKDVRRKDTETLWLLVMPEGGRVTPRFEPESMPADAVKEPGPFRYKREDSQSAAVTADQQSSLSGSITFEVVYYNDDTNSYEPLSYGTATGEIESPYTPFSYTLDEDGQFSLTCNVGYIYFWTAKAKNTFFEVRPDTDVGTYDDAPVCNTTDQLIAGEADAAHIFVNARLTGANATAEFGFSRSLLKIHYNPSASNASYSSVGDSVILASGDVWGEGGAQTIAHELGHAYHEKAFQGLPGGCPGSHARSSYTNLGCAFQEGFADYFMLITRPDAATANPFDDLLEAFEDNIYLTQNSNPNGSDPNDPNGTLIEGAVTAMLLDITDSANETGDPTSYSETYIAGLMDTCKATHGTQGPADGIDHIIYCMEKQIDSGVATYFYARGTQPSAYSESVTEPGSWNLTNIRNSWLRNLFDE